MKTSFLLLLLAILPLSLALKGSQIRTRRHLKTDKDTDTDTDEVDTIAPTDSPTKEPKEETKCKKKVEKEEKEDKEDKEDKVDKADKEDKTDKADKDDKTDKEDKEDKADKTDKADKDDTEEEEEEDLPYCEEEEEEEDGEVGASSSETEYPGFSSTRSVDCSSIESGVMPSDADSLDGDLVMEVNYESGKAISDVLGEMETVLQSDVALAVAGCSPSGRRLQSESVGILGAEFSSPEEVADSSCTATSTNSDCAVVSTDVKVYYQGNATDQDKDDMFDYMSGIAEDVFSTSETFSGSVSTVESNFNPAGASTSESADGLPVSTLAMVVGAIAILGGVGILYMYKRSSDEEDGEAANRDWEAQDAQWELEENEKGAKEKKLDNYDDQEVESIPVADATPMFH